jgi:hypothetical protein
MAHEVGLSEMWRGPELGSLLSLDTSFLLTLLWIGICILGQAIMNFLTLQCGCMAFGKAMVDIRVVAHCDSLACICCPEIVYDSDGSSIPR